MTSAINTSGLNNEYPVAGVNQSSQGFRDNFNNIKQNLDTAATEITDLQARAVLKSALPGANLDNNMAGAVISNAQTRGFRGTGVNLGTNISGTATIDTNAADVYFGTITGDTTLAFTKWAPAGTLSEVRVILTAAANSVANINLPSQIDASRISLQGIAGANSTVIVPQNAFNSVVDLVFSTVDCGNTVTVLPFNKPGKTSQVQLRAINSTGNVGDVIGSLAYDTVTNQLYFANGNYTGTAAIWTAVGSNGGGGGSSSQIANGTANVVTFTNGNVIISAAGAANRVVVTGSNVIANANLTVTANISANFITANGNLTTFGNFSVSNTSNFAGNVNLINTVLSTGTGNISGGNLSMSGIGLITGNLTIGANLTANGRANITGNVTGGNFITTGFANVGGNVLAGNLNSNASVTGVTFISTNGNIQVVNGSSRKVTIQPSTAGAFTANWTLTLPPNDGDPGQVLTTDGTGTTSWVNVGAGQVANGSSNISIASSANITFNVTGNTVATLSPNNFSVNGNISANFLAVTQITSNGNITVSGAGNQSITSTTAQILLNPAVSSNVFIPGNVVVANANSSSTTGYLRAALIANTLPNSFTPASNGDSGIAGSITFDSNYLYFCISSGNWRRIPLTW